MPSKVPDSTNQSCPSRVISAAKSARATAARSSAKPARYFNFTATDDVPIEGSDCVLRHDIQFNGGWSYPGQAYADAGVVYLADHEHLYRDGDGAISAGLGHGGAESVLFGLSYAAGTVAALFAPDALPQATRDALAGASPWVFVGTGLDRLPALAGHLVFALLIVLAYRRGVKFLLIAIAAHAALDFSMFMLRDHAALPVFIAAWAAAGLLCLVLARRLYGSLRRPAPEPAPPTPVAA